jgi:hypothetical protein
MITVVLNGTDFDARQYIGIGYLLVGTRVGEVKVKSTDWILSDGVETLVVSDSLYRRMFPIVGEQPEKEEDAENASAPAVNTYVSTVSSSQTGSTTAAPTDGLASLGKVDPQKVEAILKIIRDKQAFLEKLTPGEEEFLKLHGG